MSIIGSYGQTNEGPKFRQPDFAYPQTVVRDAKELLAGADKSSDPGVVRLRAMLELCCAEQNIDYDTIFGQPAQVERQIALCGDDNAAKALLTLYQANLYKEIYNHSSYKYNQVSAPLEPFPADVSKWSGDQFRARIVSLLNEARTLAGSTPLSRFSSSINYSPEVEQYLPTVADFARYYSVNALNDIKYGTANYDKEILDICREGIVASAPQSAPWFYWQVEDIRRGSLSRDGKEEALVNLYSGYKNVEAARYVLKQISGGFNPDYVEYEYEEEISEEPVEADRIRKRDRIIEWLRASLAEFPSWYGNAVLNNSLARFTQPRVRVSVPSMAAPDSNFKVNVRTEFAKKVVVSFHRMTAGSGNMDAAAIVRTMPMFMKAEISDLKTDHSEVLKFNAVNPGNYVLVVSVDGKYGNSSTIPVLVTPLLGISAGVGPDAAAIAVDFASGKPLQNVRVTMSRRRGSSMSLGKTDRKGLLKFSAPTANTYSSQWLVFGYKGQVYDFDRNVNVYSYYKVDETESSRILVFTDRSIYHPGDSVRWAVAVAAGKDKEGHVVAGQNLEVKLYDANYQPVDTVAVTTDAFGRASGSFVTRTGVLTGAYRIRASYREGDRTYDGSANIMVSDFKAPEIQIESISVQRDVPSKGDVTLEGTVRTYSGMPVAGAKVAISVKGAERWRWFIPAVELGSLDGTTDDSGNFTVVVPASMLGAKVSGRVYSDFAADVTVTSRTAETAEKQINFTNGKPYVIVSDVPADADSDKPFEFTPDAFDANGKNVAIALRWRFVATDKNARVQDLPSGETNAGTPVKVDLRMLPSATYKIAITPADTTLASDYETSPVNLYSVSRGTMPKEVSPLYIPDATARVKGGKATVTVGVNSDRLYVYSIVRDGDRMHEIGVHELTRGFHNLELAVPAGAEDLGIRLMTVLDGKNYSSDVAVRMPEAEKTEVVAETFRDRLAPGSPETWRFRLTSGKSVLSEAAMIATMYNEALEALQASNWPGVFSWWSPRGYINMDTPYLSTIDRRISLPLKYKNVKNLTWPDFMFAPSRMYYIRGMRSNMLMSTKQAIVGSVNAMAETENVAYDMAAPMMKSEAAAGSAGAVTEETEEAATEDSGASEPKVEYRDAEVLQAFWKPNLVSDSEGNIDIEFIVPNANGSWRFLGFGWDKAAQSAVYRGLAVASKPVMVSPNLPRYLRQGDKTTVLATVFNNSDREATVTTTVEIFRIADGSVTATYTSTDTIAAQGSAVVGAPVSASATEASIGYRIRAVSGSFADGEQAAIPVLKSVSTVIESEEFYLNPNDATPFELTVNAPEDAVLTLQYCQNPVWTIVKAMRGIAADEALTANGIVSHLFSALAAEHIVGANADIANALKQWRDNPDEKAFTSMLEKNETLKKLMLDQTPWVQAAKSNSSRMAMLASLLDPAVASAAVEKYMNKLAKLQNGDGGFRWGSWSVESSEWTTRNVLVTLGIARSLGMLTDKFDPMLCNAFTYLQVQAAKPDRPVTDDQLALIAAYFPAYPRTVAGQEIIRRTVAATAANWKNGNTVDKAYDTFILNANGRKAEAAKVMASIRQFAVAKPGMGLCFPNVNDMRGYATIIQAYSAMDASTEEIDALRQYVIVQAQALDDIGAGNPDYIVASVLMTGSDWTSVPVAQNVAVNGAPLAISSMESSTGYFSQTLNEKGKVRISVKPNGVTPSYGSVITIMNQPSRSIKARPGRDLAIEKRFLVERDGKWIETEAFTLGERVRVQLTVKAKRNLEYVSIDDERPASFEPVDQLPGYVWDASLGFYRENLDASTRFFIGYLPKGTYHISVDMTAAAQGIFISGIATLQSQYAPELTAHSGGTAIEVK